MSELRITGVGGYLPLLRLDRRAAAGALRWSGLGGPKAGRRAVAGWDEDAVTLAVEACRALPDAAGVHSLVFASTSAPFFERSQAGIVADALALGRDIRTNDVSGSRRCAVSALLAALLGSSATLVAAGERRTTQPGNALQLAWGDGGAAVTVAPSEGGLRLLGHASTTHDLVDVYASRARPHPYQSEERFIRDIAAAEVLGPTIGRALDAANLSADEIAAAVVHEPVAGVYRALGLKAPNLAEELALAAGDLGAAHPLFALALALDTASVGDKLLVAGFGSGCDALVLEVAGPVAGAATARSALAEGVTFADYVRFLSLTGSLELDWGPRAEVEQKTSASVLERYGRDITGFIGGRDDAGNVQFPKSPTSVAPGGGRMAASVRLADEPARVVSITADRLNYTPDPPFHFGLAQFENGARVLMEFTDVEGAPPAVGDPLRMRFRVKSIDKRRGFRSYFWKAAPVERPRLGE